MQVHPRIEGIFFELLSPTELRQKVVIEVFVKATEAVQELVAKLGPPTAKAKQPDGSPVYIYAKSSKSGATTTFSCVVRYLIDARNERITGHQIEGC